MRVSDFHFDLPEELIAQHPPAERGSSRMLVLDRGSGALADAMFRDLPEYLRAGDLLVLNDSRVLPARLFAVRRGLGTQAGSPQPSGMVEVLLTEEIEGGANPTSQGRDVGHPILWRALVRPAKKVRVGETLLFFDRGERGRPALTAEVVEAGEFGERTLRFAAVEDFYGVVGRIGHMPLPPYIKRERGDARAREASDNVDAARTAVPQGLKPRWFPGGDGTAEAVPLTKQWGSSGLAGETVAEGFEAEDRERYQTVYAQTLGSAAAPTAGLHFTPEMLAALRARGVEIAYVTLHVGLGTFQPVRVDRVEEIRLHAERYSLPAATADALNRAMAEGRRVVAVGTTTTRALEHMAVEVDLRAQEGCPQGLKPDDEGRVDGTGEPVPLSKTGSANGEPAFFEAHSGSTSIFIGPGYRFRVVKGLLTNFHLPESTLLMLVAAFAGEHGRETVLAAYEHAVRERYRFYSYGDCMLVM